MGTETSSQDQEDHLPGSVGGDPHAPVSAALRNVSGTSESTRSAVARPSPSSPFGFWLPGQHVFGCAPEDRDTSQCIETAKVLDSGQEMSNYCTRFTLTE